MADAIDSATGSQASEGLDRDTLIVAGVVMLGAVMSILDTTVVNVAIDRLAVVFNASLTTIQWVVTGYTLSLAAVIPVTGWAADRFGTKRIYMTSLVLFTLGSVAAGLSWSAESMIVFRVLQGLGGGMIMPAVMTIMTKKAGPHRMGRVMGVLGVPMLLAPILGPILGGWLVDNASWRWIFFINVPIGIVAFILALIVLDSDESQPSHRFDWLGMMLLSPGLAVFIYGLAESSTYGFGALRSSGPATLGVVLIAAFLVHSWRADAPLLDIRLFARTRAGAAAGVFLLFAISVFGSLLLVPLYFQSVRGASALTAGLLMAPGGVGAMLTMPLSGRLTDRHGPNWMPVTGLPLVAIGLLPFAFVGAHTSYVLLCSFNFIQGIGMGFAMMPLMTAAMQSVPTGGDRSHQHCHEHRPANGRLDRHRGPVGDPRLGDRLQPRPDPRHDPFGLGLERSRLPAAPARRPARGDRRPARGRVREHVRVGRGAGRRGNHPGAGDGADGQARAGRRLGATSRGSARPRVADEPRGRYRRGRCKRPPPFPNRRPL